MNFPPPLLLGGGGCPKGGRGRHSLRRESAAVLIISYFGVSRYLCPAGERKAGGGADGSLASRRKGGKPFVGQKITHSFQDMGKARLFEEGGARRPRKDSSRSALSSNSRSLKFLANQVVV
jgi:hypothetical protein